ncbi:MAG TPA: sialate O-acetylesterase [Steroidobacteraceae bacterium]|nr:sialate O-acetylesterase [Steroidobacteraceae bacterium]
MKIEQHGRRRNGLILGLGLALLPGIGQVQPAPAPPSLRFADVFGPGMVLPHGQPLTLSGTAAPRQKLKLSVDGREYELRSDSRGLWRREIAPLAAGGPYSIVLDNGQGETAELDQVLAGEVWLCSGQSNMEFTVGMSSDQPAEALEGQASIRLLPVRQQTALQAGDSFPTRPAWLPAGPSQIRSFSAVCYFFARQRLADTGVPIGVINASWGGSAIEPWMSERQLATWPSYRHQVDLLRQYRADRRKAELAFAADWVQWWNASSSEGPVWEQGVLTGRDWQEAPLRDWRTYPDARLAFFTGSLWYSSSFTLTEEQSRRGASFVLGRVDEVDTTWVNGKFVANTFGYGTRREYRLEPGVLRAGTNQVSTMVTSTYEAGGLLGPQADVGIRFDNGEFLALGESWKYRFVPKQTGYPPRAPWESVKGVSGMFNGMIAPLSPLAPTGVIWYQGESNVDKASEYGPLLTGLISDWRRHFGRQMPFIVVQLPNYGAVAQSPAESGWAMLRHVQQQAALHDDSVGLVPTQDLGDDTDIHPRRKFAVALRVAEVARALEARAPSDGVVPRLAALRADTIELEFSPPLPAADAARLRVSGFILCGATSASCVPAVAEKQGSRIAVSRTALPEATRVRYCWSDGGTCALRSLGDLPVGSFELSIRRASK